MTLRLQQSDVMYDEEHDVYLFRLFHLGFRSALRWSAVENVIPLKKLRLIRLVGHGEVGLFRNVQFCVVTLAEFYWSMTFSNNLDRYVLELTSS